MKRVLTILVLSALLFDFFVLAVFKIAPLREALPRLILMPVKIVYSQNGRLIRAGLSHAQYDPVLTYTLKPGVSRFKNIEFDTEYRVNSKGLRDDEASLSAPDLIVAGDSFAMGWGVEQDQNFPSLVEKENGLKVLNAAIASYGTAREMTLMNRLDTSRLRYLVIQYCANDAGENIAFKQAGRLPVKSEEAYRKMLDSFSNHSKRKYYPGYYTVSLIVTTLDVLRGSLRAAILGDRSLVDVAQRDLAKSVPFFLYALKHAPPWPSMHAEDLRILVLADRSFCSALGPMVEAGDYPFKSSQIVCEPVFSEMKSSQCFPLDPHWNVQGHKAVARKVLDWLRTA